MTTYRTARQCASPRPCRTRVRPPFAPAAGWRVPRREWEEFDQRYVEALVDGNQDVERHFTGYFGELLLIKLRSRVRSAELREDIVQETFLRVFAYLKKHGGLEHPDRLGAFVNTVCTNILMEQYRRMGRSGDATGKLEDPPDQRAGAEERMVSEECTLAVRRILAGMPVKDRALLRAIFLEERDKDDVCRELNVDRDYLRVLLHRAKARFRQTLILRPTAAAA